MFFLALAIPTGFLVQHAYGQLKWEAFHQHRVLAEEFARRIDNALAELVDREEARAFTDYAFLVVEGDQSANVLQRSVLASLPALADTPGLVGHFQVDPGGSFSTPLLPADDVDLQAYGVPAAERGQRAEREASILRVLGENQLVDAVPGDTKDADVAGEARDDSAALAELVADAAPASPQRKARAQAAFDRLGVGAGAATNAPSGRSLGTVSELKLDATYSRRAGEEAPREADVPGGAATAKRAPRKEVGAVRAPAAAAPAPATADEREAAGRRPATVSLRSFESDVEPFSLSLLGSGHFVLFRKVWRDGQRYIQGALFEQQALFQGLIETRYRDTSLASMSELAVAFEGNVLAAWLGHAADGYPANTGQLGGALLYQSRLSAPFGGLELIFSVTHLPAGPGARVVAWTAGILALVLLGGCYALYRTGLRQLEVATQQQDFVSAVSHELKTPLTSIRMYGEMLRDGWAPEDKKKIYYDYITQESERLSRLIANVLQLARMTRNDLQVDLKAVTVAELCDGIRSQVSSQVERAGFTLRLDDPGELGAILVRVDRDSFSQIVINLVDNALKFSANADTRSIEIRWSAAAERQMALSIRDYGPGIPRDQMRKIFRLFYRSESELIRETVGTGIGLALVQQLARAMDASVQVANREPGAEFSVIFMRG